MTIHFIPNDPRAGRAAPALRRKTPRREPPDGRAGFSYRKPPPEGVAEPGTPQFLFWQVREAALAAVRAWEACTGQPHLQWQGRRQRLPLLPDTGEDLNAFYDRATVSFFHQEVAPGRVVYSGASTDVVAHEVGHGLLDSVRADLWDVTFLEAGAFHEAFGDCLGILTALEDKGTREALLAQAPTLRKRNFVESFAEELAWGIGTAIPGHNAAEPRHAFNRYRFQVPSSLPSDGGPGVLINEVHSFAMVFTGCFWDLIAGLYAAAPTPGPQALRTAARRAGRLLITGARNAVVTPRFFLSVGRAMLQADATLHRGRDAEAIRAAFARHGIALGTAALARGAARGEPAPAAGPLQPVPLGSLHPQLEGVVALAPTTLAAAPAGARGAAAAVPAEDPSAEVHAFVAALLARGRIALAPTTAPQARGAAAAPRRDHTTHEVRELRGQKRLVRKRFLCACHAGPGPVHTTDASANVV